MHFKFEVEKGEKLGQLQLFLFTGTERHSKFANSLCKTG
jgi:hypothetical protein